MSCKKSRCIPYSLNNCKLIFNRELGLKNKLGHSEELTKKIYPNIDTDRLQNTHPTSLRQNAHGAVFNLEFNTEGKVLVAACEHKSVLLYDAANQKHIRTINEAHEDCVNCVRFLNSHIFATCSDDATVKVWDNRHSTRCVSVLRGHSNWVKNIEYIEKDDTLVTSSFDGTIYTWDLKSPTESNVLYTNLFVMTGLMRSKISPDGTKMVLCTTSGYMVIIHDLNLQTLSNDLRSFRPNLYRLMQLSEQTFPAATVFNKLFCQSRRRNRLEFIDDFPNEAEVITSLQIHPMGWCSLSRNVNGEEREEWTAVHDIQTRPPEEYENSYKYIEEELVNHPGPGANMLERRPTDIWMGYISNENFRAYRDSSPNGHDSMHTTMGILNSGMVGRNIYERQFTERPQDRNRVVVNLPRMTHFAKEKVYAKGFIKELCFSSDGVVICSPYVNGVRLLGFNNRIQELPYCVPERPQPLYTISKFINYHPNVVLCCKFNPKHYEFASGCRSGEIVWYKPIL